MSSGTPVRRSARLTPPPSYFDLAAQYFGSFLEAKRPVRAASEAPVIAVVKPSLLKALLFDNQKRFDADLVRLRTLLEHIQRHTIASRLLVGAWHMDERLNQHIRVMHRISAGANGATVDAELSDADIDEHEQVVIKTSTSTRADYLGYEFMVGQRMNALRALVPHFALSLMWFQCNRVDLDADLPLCNRAGERSDFIVMERIYPGSSLSRHRFRSWEGVLSVILQVLMALQIAQDEEEFTHYDLHVGNVLLEQVPHRNAVFVYGALRVPLVDCMCPIIIDFGRAHVRHDAAQLKALGFPRDFQAHGERQFNGPYGIDMRKPSTFYDMVVFWIRFMDHLKRSTELPRVPSQIAAIDAMVRSSFKLQYDALPLHPLNRALQRPVDLVNELTRTSTYAGLLDCERRSSSKVFAWNRRDERGPQ